MSRFYNRRTNGLTPYVPGEQPKDQKYIKLNTNESPYPPSEAVLEAMRDAVNEDLRLYPDPDCLALKSTLAEAYDVSIENIFVGNGSDEILAFAFQAFFEAERAVRFPELTYSFYPVYAQLYGLTYELISLSETFEIPVERFFNSKGGVIIPNPNAPTSVALALAEVERIVQRNADVVVIIDEAYVDFGAESAVALVGKYPNLLVIQTFSKARALAGLRVGYAIGAPELIAGLEKVKNSFNSYTLDRIALAGAVASIKDFEYNRTIQNKIVSTRERAAKAFGDMGFRVTAAKANFIFVSPPGGNAKQLFDGLRSRGILVRYFTKTPEWLRISIGTDEEMDQLVRATQSLLVEGSSGHD